jgi:hypothetical protein
MCAMLEKHSGRHKNYTGYRIVVELKTLNCVYCRVEIKAQDHCKLCRSSMYHEPSQFSCGVNYLYVHLSVCRHKLKKRHPMKCGGIVYVLVNLVLYV